MQATQPRTGEVPPQTPSWIWVSLLIGGVIAAGWAWFIFGFMAEPSAVGRTRAVLVTWIAWSVASALNTLIATFGLVRRTPWARPYAWAVAVAVTATGVGAIAGIPALVGLFSSRHSVRN